jgi:hypothetical protein
MLIAPGARGWARTPPSNTAIRDANTVDDVLRLVGLDLQP